MILLIAPAPWGAAAVVCESPGVLWQRPQSLPLRTRREPRSPTAAQDGSKALREFEMVEIERSAGDGMAQE
ncbi:hypothetical protein NDU88_000230 [Pleurodeles waltl]|uniref:Secreted protein n=1 Tax=Pleurodeles waltl TaxID=8319 RepID=A0AAV7S8X9_PLEWA|nr:hypothetical protein NDU88_000230 [Pleurodeles waltl]